MAISEHGTFRQTPGCQKKESSIADDQVQSAMTLHHEPLLSNWKCAEASSSARLGFQANRANRATSNSIMFD